MKKWLLSMMLITASLFASAQSVPPQGITYQAVALDDKGKEIVGVDAQGLPIAERAITVRFNIIKDSPNGVIEYAETHNTNTDKYGLFTVVIGEGTPISTTQFAEIDWAAGAKFLKVDLDIENDGSFQISSIQQMMSVPYALYAAKADTAAYARASPAGDTTAQIQNLVLNGDTLSITKGNSVVLPTPVGIYKDTSATNELQTLSVNGDTLGISGGNSVVMPVNYKDTSSVNELQDLIYANDTLRLTNSNSKVFLSSSSSGGNILNPTNAYVQDGCYYTTYNTLSPLAARPIYEDTTQIVFYYDVITTTSVSILYYHYSKNLHQFIDTVNFNFTNLTPNNNWYAYGTYRKGVYFFQVGGTIFGYDNNLTLLYGGVNPTPTVDFKYELASENFVFARNSNQSRRLNVLSGAFTTITTLNPGPLTVYSSVIGDDFILRTVSSFQNSTVWRRGTNNYITTTKNWYQGFRVDTAILAVSFNTVLNKPLYDGVLNLYLLDTNYNEIKTICQFKINSQDIRIGLHQNSQESVLHVKTEVSHQINGYIISVPYTGESYELLLEVDPVNWKLEPKEIRSINEANISYYLINNNSIISGISDPTSSNEACINNQQQPSSTILFEYFGSN